MDNQRPRSREKNVTGSSKKVEKHGSGLGSGPVGDTGGRARKESASMRQGPGRANAGTRSGIGGKLIVMLLVLLLGGGGGLTALFGGSSGQDAGQANQNAQTSQTTGQASGIDLASLLGSLGGGSVSSGWQGENNTGKLDQTVADSAREKYVHLSGDGKDTVTLMVYMCGTDLESRSGMGTADLQEMLNASFGSNINLLVYTGGCNGWRNQQVSSSVNQIWQIKNGALTCLQDNLDSVPMTDPSTLSGYIQWCAKNYPASRYGLIFWDHGGGSISGYGYDEKYPRSGSMGLPGIHKALTDGNVKFDFIGFDACLMATAETALTMAQHGDYLIASEETEPGVGWYYTDWLTALGKNTSIPTIELGQLIADSFVDTCASKCPGQLTTLSVVDLSEFSATVPSALSEFSASVSTLIQAKEYQQVSNARSGAREFARSSSIDQIDLVHLAQNLGTVEGTKLADALLGAVKYNRTSSNMTNAYGVSIYFPYRKSSNVDRAISAYAQIGMDEEYSRCIKQFASLEVSGQAVSGGTTSPLPSLLGNMIGNASSSDAVSDLLNSFLGGGISSISGLTGSNTEFLSDKAMDIDEMADYLTDNRLEAGDTLKFLCDYYSYEGDYMDSYLLGDSLTVSEDGITISNVPLEGTIQATYRFTDLYNQHYWTPAIP